MALENIKKAVYTGLVGIILAATATGCNFKNNKTTVIQLPPETANMKVLSAGYTISDRLEGFNSGKGDYWVSLKDEEGNVHIYSFKPNGKLYRKVIMERPDSVYNTK